jgi:hypothetical protein
LTEKYGLTFRLLGLGRKPQSAMDGRDEEEPTAPLQVKRTRSQRLSGADTKDSTGQSQKTEDKKLKRVKL